MQTHWTTKIRSTPYYPCNYLTREPRFNNNAELVELNSIKSISINAKDAEGIFAQNTGYLKAMTAQVSKNNTNIRTIRASDPLNTRHTPLNKRKKAFFLAFFASLPINPSDIHGF